MEHPGDLLPQAHLHANKKQWTQFLSYFLLGAGIASIATGIIFFFAYNWNYLPKFIKFGIMEVLLIGVVLLAVYAPWEKFIKQSILTGATFLIGTLFAIYGQVYQTGVESFLLFLHWSLFTLLWALALRFAPLWLIFIGLLTITLWQYGLASLAPSVLPEMYRYIIWLLAISTILAEFLYVNGKMAGYNYWFILTTTTATLLMISMVLINAIFGSYHMSLSLLLTALVLFPAGLAYGWKQKRLFHMAVIPFILLVLLICLIARNSNLNVFTIFLLMVITIVGTMSVVHFTLKLKKRWYGTEK